MDDAPIEPKRQAHWRALIFPIICTLIIGAVVVAGKFGYFPATEELLQRIGAYAGSPWGLPILVLVFCVGAFLGAPQFGLMAGAILAFGPWSGVLYAWLATLCSGTLTFWAGRLGGERLFARYAGKRANKIAKYLGQNAFKASALVRLVPTGPFVLVNMTFGMSGARFSPFLAGLGIGALPKLVLVALAGQGLVSAGRGSLAIALCAVLGVSLVWGFMFWMQNRKTGI